ncbi:MAG: TonB-dependent receptor [Bacteroidota bacterium]
MRQVPQRSLLALAIAGIVGSALADERSIETERIEIVGNTPLAGVGVARWQMPANVQSVGARQLEESEHLNLPDFMASALPSVNLNETQGNPFQPDLNYRGFTASPLLGTPQGLSVYLDGVRINEPFGDTVNWDLIPNSAIAGMDLIPGSNPVFGLNTLGGALAIRTKNGFSHPGSKLEVSGGSFGRQNVELEHGGNNGALGWYMASDWFSENGWRDYSSSDVKQFFAKLSGKNAAGDFDLSLSRAVTRLNGNALLPESMLAERREQVFTHTDTTRNDLWQVALNGRLWLNDSSSLSGSVYHRRSKTQTLSGDLNNDFVGGPFDGLSSDESGVVNHTHTTQQSSGVSGQWNLTTERQQLAVGASLDDARMQFGQSSEIGAVDASRGISGLSAENEDNALRGTTRTRSLYLSDTYALVPSLHLTAAARYNVSRVTTRDELNPTPPNLDGDYSYRKLNPALGLTWQAQPALNVYAGFSQGNRVPTAIELGCADPAHPCTLPNSLASDPYLKQVVARTLEAGLRGKLPGDIEWNAGGYRTLSSDDILFVGTSTSAGYFTNYGQTRRQGLEFGLKGSQRRVDWQVHYSYLQATFQSAACLLGANNSSRGTAPECAGDEILVRPGNRLPGLPSHSLKLGLNWHVSDDWRIGGDVLAFSGQYARGNENNQDPAGRIPGYAILNLNAETSLGGGWQLFGKINNIFDKHYATAAMLAENPFAGGAFLVDSSSWHHENFVAPGAPRAAWVGVRYQFAGK